MGQYYPGAPVRLPITTLDVNGNLVDVDITTLVVAVRASDGTPQTAPTVLRDSLGTYHADFLVPTTGDANSRVGRTAQWPYKWSCTNATIALNGTQFGSFTVLAPPF